MHTDPANFTWDSRPDSKLALYSVLDFVCFLGESTFIQPPVSPTGTVSRAVGRIIDEWALVVGKGGIVYGEFKKQYDGISD